MCVYVCFITYVIGESSRRLLFKFSSFKFIMNTEITIVVICNHQNETNNDLI